MEDARFTQMIDNEFLSRLRQARLLLEQAQDEARVMDLSRCEFLTPRQVAQYLQVKPETVQGWLRSGELRGYKIGRCWRVRKDDLDAWIEKLEANRV